MTDTVQPADLARLHIDHPDMRIIDVRTPGEFAARHIPGSYNVPLPMLAEHHDELRRHQTGPVVLVCQSGRRAGLAEAKLREGGFEAVHVLDGGMLAWERSSMPIARLERDDSPWTLERQVRLAAGAIVAAAILVSIRWPAARFLAGAVGAGLVFAAVTDTCAMGRLLARLPYNTRGSSCDMPTVVSHLTTSSTADTTPAIANEVAS
jgi:rhodanese-related sulfurtransferase